jgi:hypothetical protein
VQAFTPSQIAALLKAADPETGLIIRMLACTGLRFGELAGLRWSALDSRARRHPPQGTIHTRELGSGEDGECAPLDPTAGCAYRSTQGAVCCAERRCRRAAATGYHSVAFTMDQYADAWPEALSNAGAKDCEPCVCCEW